MTKISIHASLTGGDGISGKCYAFDDISIHASLTGGDFDVRAQLDAFIKISIHASLTGGDTANMYRRQLKQDFNPRLPHGRRRPGMARRASGREISIHASLTGGDRQEALRVLLYRISIHASLTGGDLHTC